jgi:hypothetical protein
MVPRGNPYYRFCGEVSRTRFSSRAGARARSVQALRALPQKFREYLEDAEMVGDNAWRLITVREKAR